MSTASLTGSHSETRPTQEQDGSLSLDHNSHSQSRFQHPPETNCTGPPPSYNDSITTESYYSVQTYQPQPQPQSNDTRFDGSHSETEYSQNREKSNYLDSNVHSQSGVELCPVISYSQEPRQELHLDYEPRYDGVHTQQPQQQPHEHLSNNVDKPHDQTCKDRAEDCLDSCSECDCEDCCESFLACLDICEICVSCFRVCSDDD
ncbi:uncharacterized protein LOC129924480 isoform X1 [Biomphalaria glabrata]|uniref:Uncharacterized protein LOC129924480 isoform X1 n=1 Tax=Biomphalaria glabrata TaxID=6526 RepID=A0A9W2ZJB4_BIOGL|nr:uncharacterized protein LOC129924480 isoform X1 [Biomphalaria glabrata]